MSVLNIVTASFAAVILFLFGLEHFSKEIQRVSGEKFRKFLEKFTRIPIVGLFLGSVITAIIQSSSATSVIVIGLVNGGLISFKNSLGVIFGANVGTTVTALLSMVSMDTAAKKTALSHFFFNVGGVLIFLPFVSFFTEYFSEFSPEIALANIHLAFNLLASFLFLIFINPFSRLVERCVKGGHHLDFPVIEFPKVDDSLSIEEAKSFLDREHGTLFDFLKETYELVTLSLLKDDKMLYQAVEKRNAYFEYIQVEFTKFMSELMGRGEDEESSREIMKYMNRFEYLNQIQDSLEDLTAVKTQVDEMYIELKPDALEHMRNVSDQMRITLEAFSKTIHGELAEDVDMKAQLQAVQTDLNRTNRALLKIVTNPERRDSGAFARFVTVSYRLRDKLLNLREFFL